MLHPEVFGASLVARPHERLRAPARKPGEVTDVQFLPHGREQLWHLRAQIVEFARVVLEVKKARLIVRSVDKREPTTALVQRRVQQPRAIRKAPAGSKIVVLQGRIGVRSRRDYVLKSASYTRSAHV